MTYPPRATALIALLFTAHAALAGIDAAEFQRDLGQLAGHESRSITSSGYYAAAQYLETEIGKLRNVELRRHEFPVVVPVTESATIDVDGRIERIFPFWPAHVRACTTPPQGISGNLVYAGECRYHELQPASLFGQIAVVEASARQRWMDAFNMGADALLVLGRADTSWSDLSSHDLRIPVNLPRFYVPPGKLADELRAGKHSRATLKSTVYWRRMMARNYYALVRGSKPAPALMFSVPLEASSLVPGLAPGASQAVQTACGLALLRDLSRHPWGRPVVVSFTGADSIQMLGTRNMLLALAEPPALWRKEMLDLDRKIESAQNDLARASAIATQPQRLAIPADRDLIDRTVKIIEVDLALLQDELFRLRATELNQRTPQQRQQLAALESRQATLNRLKVAFQKPSSLADSALANDARDYLSRTIATLGGSAESDGLVKQHRARKSELAGRIDLYHWLAVATGRTTEPDEKQTDARLIELLVGLDLSDRSVRCGPMFFGNFQRISAMPQIQEFREWFARQQREQHVAASIDLDPLVRQNRAPSTYLAGALPLASELAQGWGVPGLSMITLNDLRLRRDTPADTLDAIDLDAILPQLRGVRDLFARAAADPKFQGPTDLKRLRISLTGQVVSASPGRPVPDLPRPGFLVTYSYVTANQKRIPELGELAWALGVRRTEVHECDADGNYLFEALPRLRAQRLEGIEKQQADMQVLAVQVYRIDPRSGAIVAATDLGKQAGDIKWWVDIREAIQPVRSLTFDCEEFALTQLYDPRFLQTLGEVVPLDARRNAEPQRYFMMTAHQMLAGFVEPQLPLYLLVRYGRVGNRLALLNSELRGYTPKELNDLGPVALATARDFHELDEHRLEQYRRAGVSAELLDSLHADADAQIDAAEAALRADDGVALVRSATGAWANEARVYHAAQAMARDVVRAAIFLLLLCVPFAFCMERLLIGTANVYRQIAGATAIFAVMTAALWSFHPAFKISTSPLIIILAFAIILMSCIVIVVIYGKFDTELKRLRSGRGGAAVGGVAIGAVASAGVLMSAVMLGLANMRRRKFRTALTSLTIVLITFAVLCFTSTTRYVGSTATPTGIESAHAGILLRQRGFRPISAILPDQLRAVLADPALKLDATPTVVERWWAISTSEPNEQYNLTAISPSPATPEEGRGEGITISVPAVLGLSPGESKLSRIAQTLGPEKFARLERGETNIIYLSRDIADQLKVNEGDTVRLGGMDLTVACAFASDDFDKSVTMLSGEPLAPLKYTAGQVDAGGRKLDDTAAESLDLDASAGEAGATYEFLPATDFVIVHADTCRRLYKSMLRSVAFRLDDERQVKAVSDELARRFSLALFAGFDDGVRMISASKLTAVSGAGVVVPLLVAGLIIFNTMMGSIAERRREIHVYTSLGLAPAHVGALFLAEAMTYGLIGSVFGYVIGQGVATALLKLGWLGSITLDYSGSGAMLSLGLILLIVLLSALVPARLASKLAAPSIDRTWNVPRPIDGQIVATLPFTINQTAADGVLAYLAEYFADHREGNIGKFAAGRVEVFVEERLEGRGQRSGTNLSS